MAVATWTMDNYLYVNVTIYLPPSIHMRFFFYVGLMYTLMTVHSGQYVDSARTG